MTTVKMAELGDNLGSRADGKIMREKIERLLAKNQNEKIIVDFGGLNMTAHSFIDESIGKLIAEYGLDFIKSKMTLKNANEFVAMILKCVISGRSVRPHVA